MPTARPLAAVPLIAAALVLAACSGGGGGGGGAPKDAGDGGTVEHGAAPSKTPAKLDTSKLDACTVLPQPDAEALIGTKVVDPLTVSNSDVASCTYQSDPNGPVGQVEVYVGDGAKQQLDIDKDQLQHPFTQPSGLGDEAWQEDQMIWARSGPTWVSIRIVTLDDSAGFVQPLQAAMSTALGNLPTS